MCSHGARLNFRNVALQQPALRRVINNERPMPPREWEGYGRSSRRMVSPVQARLLALAVNASTAYPGCRRAAARGPHVC